MKKRKRRNTSAEARALSRRRAPRKCVLPFVVLYDFGVPLTLYHQAVKDPEILISTAQKKGRKVVTTISGLKGFGTDTSWSPAASSSTV
jgi:hypothetical protein